jgi:hypothetical protein
MWEQSNNEEKILGYILAQASPINATYRYSDAKTVVHYAAINGYVKVLQLFLDNGCAVDVLDNKKNSPLLYAVAYGQHACVAKLITHGADLYQMTPKGCNACRFSTPK